MATAALSPSYRPASQSRQRCISSNFIVVHQDGGKSPIMTKQSSFNINGDGSVTETPRPDFIHDNEEEVTESPETEIVQVEKKKLIPVVKLRVLGCRNQCEALRESVRILRWKITSKPGYGPSDIYWHPYIYDTHAHINTTEHSVFATSKIPGMLDISLKVYMSRILKRMQYLFPNEFGFYSPTWILPEQYHQFIGEYLLSRQRAKNGTDHHQETKAYIVKPDAGKQGDGIYIVNDARDVVVTTNMTPVIVQEYIQNPMLLDGFKFDLRIYAVVARLQPLELYICKEGLVRLCTTPYEPANKKNIHNTFMHLTNYSVNRISEDYIHTDAGNSGSKRLFSIVEKELEDAGYDIEKQREQIRNVVLKTILAFMPDLTVWNHVTRKPEGARPFQILGFDIMLSDDMKAHLIEVNAAPSLRIDAEQETEPGSGVKESITSVVDREVKVRLIKDTLHLIAYGERKSHESCLERIYPKPKNQMTEGEGKQGEKYQRCPHCNAIISIPSTKVKVQYNMKDPVCEADWNFFDAREAGLSLIATERHPMILEKSSSRQSKYLQGSESPNYKNQSKKEKFEKCKHCNRYLKSEVGPGILEERRIEQDEQTWDHESRMSTHQTKVNVVGTKVSPAPTETTFWDVLRDVEKMSNDSVARRVREKLKSRENIDHLLQRKIRYNRKLHKAMDARAKDNFINKNAWMLNRAAHVFIYFTGFTPKLTMSSTAFRNMARKCELCDHGAMPSIDIMFCDMVRLWNNNILTQASPYYSNASPQNTAKLSQGTGLPFQGFIEALLRIAGQRYKGDNIAEKLENLIENCENYIKHSKKKMSKNSANVDIAMTLAQKQSSTRTPRRMRSNSHKWTHE